MKSLDRELSCVSKEEADFTHCLKVQFLSTVYRFLGKQYGMHSLSNFRRLRMDMRMSNHICAHIRVYLPKTVNWICITYLHTYICRFLVIYVLAYICIDKYGETTFL